MHALKSVYHVNENFQNNYLRVVPLLQFYNILCYYVMLKFY